MLLIVGTGIGWTYTIFAYNHTTFVTARERDHDNASIIKRLDSIDAKLDRLIERKD